MIKILIISSLQTPVFALYSVPTIVASAILLTIRQLGLTLPSSPSENWWELFDTEWEDVWNVSGFIMRLYRPRAPEEKQKVMRLVNKKEVRKWLETNGHVNNLSNG